MNGYSSLPYFQNLLVLRKILEEGLTVINDEVVRMFPSNCCNDTVRVVYECHGLLEVGGYYNIPDIPPEEREDLGIPRQGEQHAWNLDPERRLYLDLTGEQFGDREGIIIVPENDPLLVPCDDLTRMQRTMILPDADRILGKLESGLL